MDLGIKGKRALVCASSKGLGLGCAEALAEAGVDLVMNARGAADLETAAERIRQDYGVEVTTIAADIATSGVFGWRTSSQQAASPNSMQIAMDRSASGPVMLNPPDRTRMALRSERTRMAEDLLALLRRRYRS